MSNIAISEAAMRASFSSYAGKARASTTERARIASSARSGSASSTNVLPSG